jgi:hypothetical protein
VAETPARSSGLALDLIEIFVLLLTGLYRCRSRLFDSSTKRG